MNTLIDAVIRGSLADVTRALADGIAWEGRDERGWTAAMHAVHMDRPELLTPLIDAGADPSALEYKPQACFGLVKRTTLLHLAAGFGSTKVVQLLLDRGVPVDLRDDGETTPLFHAVQEGVGKADHARPLEVISFLIAKGADIDARDKRGNTILGTAELIHSAVGEAKLDLLIRSGVVLDGPDTLNFLKGADRWPCQLDQKLALYKKLQAAGFDPHTHPGALALAAAVNPEIVAVMLEAGSASKPEVDLALSATAEVLYTKPGLASVRLLLTAGPSVGANTLTLAKALAYVTDSEGSPLPPISRELLLAVRLLVAAGARPDVPTSLPNQTAALHHAAILRSEKAQSLKRISEIWDALLPVTKEIDVTDADGQTALHRAIGFWCPWNVERLLTHGADPDKKSTAGDSARDLASKIANPETRSVFERLAGSRAP